MSARRASVMLLAAALAAATAPAALHAQATRPAPDEDKKAPEKEFDFDEFADKAQRALEALKEKLGPMLEALGDKVGELSDYHAPELLPNGDIIIRRKRPGEEHPPGQPPAPPGQPPQQRPAPGAPGGDEPVDL